MVTFIPISLFYRFLMVASKPQQDGLAMMQLSLTYRNQFFFLFFLVIASETILGLMLHGDVDVRATQSKISNTYMSLFSSNQPARPSVTTTKEDHLSDICR